jgi:hypothetical protein
MSKRLKVDEKYSARVYVLAYTSATPYKRIESAELVRAALSEVAALTEGQDARFAWVGIFDRVPRAAYNALLASKASELSCVYARAALAWTQLYNKAMKGE